MKLTIRYFIFSLLAAATLQGQTSLQVGVRPQAMGGAFVALANDINAIYWNPAGLCQLSRGESSFMQWGFQDISQINVNNLMLSYPVWKGSAGFSWTRLNADLEQGPEADVSAMTENQFTLAYGMAVTPRIALGAGVERMLIFSEAGTGAGLAMQLGGLVNLMGDRMWTIGFLGRNIFADLDNETVAPRFTAGTAFRLQSRDNIHEFSLAADLEGIREINGEEGFSFNYAAGAEYRVRLNGVTAALRGGMGTNIISYGFGFGYSGFSLDYAYISMREKTIGDAFKVGVSFAFGSSARSDTWTSRPQPGPVETSAPVRRTDDIVLIAERKDNRIHLSWNAVAGASGYQVIGRQEGSAWTNITNRVIHETAFTIPIRRGGVTLQFIVAAVKDGKVHKRSKTVTISL